MSFLVSVESIEVEGLNGSGMVASAFGDVQVVDVFEGRDDGDADRGQVGGPVTQGICCGSAVHVGGILASLCDAVSGPYVDRSYEVWAWSSPGIEFTR